MIVIGTAGWSIPRAAADAFPGSGTHLERYARVFPGAEINSSFHRPHAFKVYAKWAAMTPPDFRFSVKLPRTITHDRRLQGIKAPLEQFLAETAGLGDKLGPLLVQLPPSLEFNPRLVRAFFQRLRDRWTGPVVCEPRHASWFLPRPAAMLVQFQAGLAAADPSAIPAATIPGGWLGPPAGALRPIAYYRLHGSPRVYWSRYPIDRVEAWAAALLALPPGIDGWCMFDNTASGSAAENALELIARIKGQRLPP
jgi:uncharacterized protein YecE (DUF72 family)